MKHSCYRCKREYLEKNMIKKSRGKSSFDIWFHYCIICFNFLFYTK